MAWLSLWLLLMKESNSNVVFLVLVCRRRNVAEELEAVSASALLSGRSVSPSPPLSLPLAHLRRPARAVVAVCNQGAIIRRWRPPCCRRLEFIGLKSPDLIRSGVSGLPVRDRMQQPRCLPAIHRGGLGTDDSVSLSLARGNHASHASLPLKMLGFLHCESCKSS
jgi:hypothetical protein